MLVKLCKIITGIPIQPIVVGSPALICKNGRVMKTSDVVWTHRVSATEVRFETRHSMYVLNVTPVRERKVVYDR